MEMRGQSGPAAPGPLWSHLAGWHDLLVPVTATDASCLDLEDGWPDRWLVTRRVGGDKVSRTVLDTDTWQEITNRLPPTPGPFQPVIDDRKRQEASAFTWAYVTQGEPRFAPRPIEARQPEPARKDWAPRRGNLWHKLAHPGRFVHYIELCKLLIEHGGRLAKDIDYSE